MARGWFIAWYRQIGHVIKIKLPKILDFDYLHAKVHENRDINGSIT